MDHHAHLHPTLAAVVATHHLHPAAEHDSVWMDGAMPLRITAYTGPASVTAMEKLPLEIVSSIRCITRVGDKYVFCENKTSRHPWPGGRRNPGESFTKTAARELHEETGWHLTQDPQHPLRPLGWLHLRHLGPEPQGNEGPYPDFLQLVFLGEATRRAADLPADADWTDPDGYELSSRLATLDEAIQQTSTDMHAQVFLELLRDGSRVR